MYKWPLEIPTSRIFEHLLLKYPQSIQYPYRKDED